MKRSCNPEDLEALAEGGLSPEDAAEVNAHAASCAECGEELKWLRTERELMRRRAAREPLNDVAQLWSGVEARLEKPRPQRAWYRPLAFSTALAAAAVLAFIAGREAADKAHHTDHVVAAAPGARITDVSVQTGRSDRGRPDPMLVLEEAEAQWRAAARVMEQRYVSERAHLGKEQAARLDQALSRTRESIAEARGLADSDVDARLAVLDGTAVYVQSLHRVVSDLEVAR